MAGLLYYPTANLFKDMFFLSATLGVFSSFGCRFFCDRWQNILHQAVDFTIHAQKTPLRRIIQRFFTLLVDSSRFRNCCIAYLRQRTRIRLSGRCIYS